MNRILVYALWLMACCGCGLKERENALKKKLDEVAQREQELALREKSVQLREEELNARQKTLDSVTSSVGTDTLLTVNPQLPGTWSVKMTCIETTCHGSAVGDTKSEQWAISYQDNTVIAKAMTDGNLVRIYSGNYRNNMLELAAQLSDTTASSQTKMIVRLQPTKEDEMEGQREITQAAGCRILYALSVKKQ